MSGELARLVVAAPASGHGKTTVTTGLLAALTRAGHRVSGHKVGPDYIDPGYHALATGLPGRNLDPHLVGEERLVPLLLHGARSGGADLAVVEGVMGLHDGMLGGDGFASTAHVARATRTPVVLVVDVSHASRSIAALVQGMVGFDPEVRVAGVILNKAGSQRHADEVLRALEHTGVPVLGVLFRDDGVVAPSRHLGLVPAAERLDAVSALDRLAAQVGDAIDLEELVRIARSAPPLDGPAWDPDEEAARLGLQPPPVGDAHRPVVAAAGGRAFTFRYAETTELLQSLGCDVAVFDPLEDEALPDGVSGLYLGGGFPEVHAAALSANEPLRRSLGAAVAAGVPTVAECAGLLYLCRSLDGAPMVGAIPADAAMTSRLTLGYRTSVAPDEHLLAAAGTRVTGHEFHRTAVTPGSGAPHDLRWHEEPDGPVAPEGLVRAWTGRHGDEGFATTTLHASYLHTHWAGHPRLAARFASAVAQHVPGSSSAATPHRARGGRSEHESTVPALTPPAPAATRPADPLRHHGDVEVAEGLLDLAVNVLDEPRPDWLDDALRGSLDDLGRYPDATPAAVAIARRHTRPVDHVLPTAGAAEAFSLVARARAWRRPVVVHPQFTEPDVALRAAGHEPTHVLLGHDFALDPDRVPEDADLVVVGNPTNPTGVLHPAAAICALLRPHRVVVVDEAFLDTVPGEQHALADRVVPGLLVLRSLTKLWSIPGVRAGYVLGEPGLVDELRVHQSPWSVSTTAVAAMVACSSPQARSEAARRAALVARHRAVLTDGLTEQGIAFLPSEAPFVLAQVGRGTHARLRAAGYAVRRADTFPGLDDSWVRIAVRRPDVTRKLLVALRTERA